MKRGWSAASTMAVFTPLTSVTTTSAVRPSVESTRRTTAATAAAGVATKTTSAVEVVARGVDHPRIERLALSCRVLVDPGDVPAPAAQREGDRPTDQAGPDDDRTPAPRSLTRAFPRRGSPQAGRSSRSTWAPWR